MRESEGENDWSTWYWCEIMIEYFVQFSTDASFNILFEYQSCVHLGTVVYLLQYSWNLVSLLCGCWSKTCFFIVILAKVCLIKKTVLNNSWLVMNSTLIRNYIRNEKVVSLLNVINPQKKKENVTTSNWFIFEVNNDNLIREKTMWNC